MIRCAPWRNYSEKYLRPAAIPKIELHCMCSPQTFPKNFSNSYFIEHLRAFVSGDLDFCYNHSLCFVPVLVLKLSQILRDKGSWPEIRKSKTNLNLIHANIWFLYFLKTPGHQSIFSGNIEIKRLRRLTWLD